MSEQHARILSIATATPPYKLSQNDIAEAARSIFGETMADFERFLPVYRNAAIDSRYSSVPLEWYKSSSTLSQRNARYINSALELLEEAACKALVRADLG